MLRALTQGSGGGGGLTSLNIGAGATAITGGTAGRFVLEGTGPVLADDAGATFTGTGATLVATLNGLTVTAAPTFSALTATRIPFAGTAGLLGDSANLIFSSASTMLTVGSGSTTNTGVVSGYTGTSGYAGLWPTSTATPGIGNYSFLMQSSLTSINVPSGTIDFRVANGAIGGFQANGFMLAPGGALRYLLFNAAPTISSGFGSSPSIASNNGSSTFRVNVGTGGVASTGVIGLGTATNGWNAIVEVFNAGATNMLQDTIITASDTTTITLGNFTAATGVAAAWPASTILIVHAMAY